MSGNLTWRLKEISDLKAAVVNADERAKVVLLRALVAICYAHWEGFVKFSCVKYMQFVAYKRLSYGELEAQFTSNLYIPTLNSLSNQKTSVKEQCRIIQEVKSCDNKRFVFSSDEVISTRSNLNSKVLSDLCLICSIDIDDFTDDFFFIDKKLVDRRNPIAHGEEPLVGLEELDDLAGSTVTLMRKFGNKIDKKAQLKSFLRPST